MCACIVLTQAGSEEAKTYAAGSLRQLSVSESHQAAIVSAGGIAALLELMRSGTKDHRAEAADALHNLSMVDDSNQIAVARGGGIETLVELVRSGSEEEKTAAASALRTVSLNEDNQIAVAEKGGLEVLIELLRTGEGDGKVEAAGMHDKVSRDGRVRAMLSHILHVNAASSI